MPILSYFATCQEHADRRTWMAGSTRGTWFDDQIFKLVCPEIVQNPHFYYNHFKSLPYMIYDSSSIASTMDDLCLLNVTLLFCDLNLSLVLGVVVLWPKFMVGYSCLARATYIFFTLRCFSYFTNTSLSYIKLAGRCHKCSLNLAITLH